MADTVQEKRLVAIHSDSRGSSGALKLLVGAFTILVLGVILGIFWDWSTISASMGPHGQLLEGLIANGISVVLSVVLIAPLTAYFIDSRRERRLVPIREGFLEGLGAAIERVATAQLHYLSFHYLQVQGLQATIAIDMMEAVTKKVTESLAETTAKIEHATPPELGNRESIVSKLISKTTLIQTTTQRHYDIMYRETQDIENTLTFAMPQFPVEAVNHLHRIRLILMEYRERLRAMLAVLNGVTDPVTLGQAGMSVLDFRDLLKAFESVRRVCALDDKPINLPWAIRLAEPGAVYQQGQFAKALLDMFNEAREADHRLNRVPVVATP